MLQTHHKQLPHTAPARGSWLANQAYSTFLQIKPSTSGVCLYSAKEKAWVIIHLSGLWENKSNESWQCFKLYLYPNFISSFCLFCCFTEAFVLMYRFKSSFPNESFSCCTGWLIPLMEDNKKKSQIVFKSISFTLENPTSDISSHNFWQSAVTVKCQSLRLRR